MAEGNAIQLTDSPEVIGVEVTALALRKKVQDLDEKIKLFAKIATAEQFEQVAEIGIQAATAEKEALEFYEPECKQLHAMWKAKTDERASVAGPAERIKKLAGRLTGEWTAEQERKRLEEIRRQEEIERQKAETEVIEEAAILEKEGRVEEAEALISSPVPIAPVNVASNVPKVRGMSAPRGTYKAVIKNLRLLVKAVAEGKVRLEAIEGNQSFLDSQARAFMSTENMAFPGVEVEFTSASSFKRRK